MICELQLQEKRVLHPSLFTNKVREQTSNIMWNTTLSKRDLLELLIALDSLSAITKTDGSVLPFSILVESFANFLNLKISNPYKERDMIMSRPPKPDDFMKRLSRRIVGK